MPNRAKPSTSSTSPERRPWRIIPRCGLDKSDLATNAIDIPMGSASCRRDCRISVRPDGRRVGAVEGRCLAQAS